MAKFLQKLLNIDEPLLTNGLSQLEKVTGRSGIDTRLIADITHASHNVMRRLGLDPTDTTGRELYHALVMGVRHGIAETLLMDTDFVLIAIHGDVISFNLIDTIENTHHELSFEQRIISHGRRSLRGELVSRYLSHGTTNVEAKKNIAASVGLIPESDEAYIALYNQQKQL